MTMETMKTEETMDTTPTKPRLVYRLYLAFKAFWQGLILFSVVIFLACCAVRALVAVWGVDQQMLVEPFRQIGIESPGRAAFAVAVTSGIVGGALFILDMFLFFAYRLPREALYDDTD